MASYANASLTEVVDGYWAALGVLGYGGSVTGGMPVSTTYTFGGAAGAFTATFTQAGEANDFSTADMEHPNFRQSKAGAGALVQLVQPQVLA